MTAEWIPRTKFIPPQLPQGMLQRPELLNTLYQAVTTRRLTLVSAQAGAGKTTLAAALPVVYPDLPLAWISIDSADDDPLTFLTLVLTAVQELLPGCQMTSVNLTTAPEAELDPLRVVGIFINDIMTCAPEPFLLVLDDLHTLNDRRIMELLDYLLEHLPPSMHLLITTRHDPSLSLARLRARGQMVELRMDQLQFDKDETDALLRQIMGFALDEKEIAVLAGRSEGWVAALRLLALSMNSLSDAEREQFLSALGASNQYIFDYLADEVLRRQNADMRQFLLQTAILEELTSTLCTAVTGDNNAPALLRETFRQNLFLTRCREIDGNSNYRYHALFRQFLLSELRLRYAQELPALHLRAAEALGNSPQAIRHCLEGRLWLEAAERIEMLAREQLNRSYVNPRFDGWLKALPSTVKDEQPLLQLLAGRLLIQSGQLSDAKPALEQALAGFRALGDIRGELNALMFLNQSKAGNDPTYLPDIKRLMDSHPEIASPSEKAIYHIALMWSAIFTQDRAAASENWQQAAAVALAGDDPGPFQIISLSMTPPLLFLQNGLEIIQDLVTALGERFPHDEGLLRLGRLMGESIVAIAVGRIAEAEQVAEKALGLSRVFGQTAWTELSAQLALGNALLAQGAYANLDNYLRSLLATMGSIESYNARRADMLGILAQSLWNQDKWLELAKVHHELVQSAIFDEQKMLGDVTSGMLAISEGRVDKAVEHLRSAINQQRQWRMMTNADVRVTLAQILWYSGSQEAALREFSAALGDWSKRDMPGIILFSGQKSIPLLKAAIDAEIYPDTAQHLLNQMQAGGGARHLTIPGSAESLTPREVEVLTLISSGMSNRAIAKELVVSERTVKTHVTHILAKLQVRSRTQAVSRIRELGISL